MAWMIIKFEDWLLENGYYDEETVRDDLYWRWYDNPPSPENLEGAADLERFLVYMARFAVEKVLGEAKSRMSIRIIPFVGFDAPSSITVVELTTKTVLGYVEVRSGRFEVFEMERVLKELIGQLRESEKIVATRALIEG